MVLYGFVSCVERVEQLYELSVMVSEDMITFLGSAECFLRERSLSSSNPQRRYGLFFEVATEAIHILDIFSIKT